MSLLDGLRYTLRIPVIGAPMYIASAPELVIAQCISGIVGAFPALNARPESELAIWIKHIQDALKDHQAHNPDIPVAPFAVNQICHGANARLEHDLAVCVDHKVPIIITSLRPPADVIAAVHAYGGVVLHDVISVRHAEKALEQGVDGLIAVCAGAGGHAGAISPLALVSEIRRFFDGPLALSGAVSTGDNILAAQAMGADFAYMGTRFLASEEANIDEAYKQMICNHAARDIIYTPVFSGVPGNYMIPSVEAAGFRIDDLDKLGKGSMDFNETLEPDPKQPKAWRDIWSAGHGIGTIKAVEPTARIIDKLETEYRAARDRIARLNT